MVSSKNRKLQILIVIEYFSPHIGGVERVMEEVGKRLVKYDHTVQILTTQEHSTVNPQGIRITRLAIPHIGRRYLFALVLLPYLLWKYRDVDVLHCANNYTVALPTWVFARLTGKRVTMSIWEIWGKRWLSMLSPISGIFHWFYEALILRLPFDGYFVPSDYVRKQIVHKTNVHLTPLGGKNLRYSSIARQKLRKQFGYKKNFVFFSYGRLGASKGVDILNAAFARLEKKFPHAKLYVTHPETQPIPEDQLSHYLSMADCVVIPDISASFGLNALEASEIGRPIVTTTAGALPEVVYGKVIFAHPGSVDSLIRAMGRAIRNKYKLIPKKRFSWEKTAQIYESVLTHTMPTK